MKMYPLNCGLMSDSNIHKAIGIEKPWSLDALLLKEQAYIAYEEKKAASAREPKDFRIPRSSRVDDPPPQRGGEKIKEDRSLQKCKNTEFKES